MYRPSTSHSPISLESEQFSIFTQVKPAASAVRHDCRYKLHVSIPESDYTPSTIAAINGFIIDYIRSGRGKYAIESFKWVESAELNKSLQSKKLFLYHLPRFFEALSSGGSAKYPLQAWYDYFNTGLTDAGYDFPSLPALLAMQQDERKQLENDIATMVNVLIDADARFEGGSQYTLYLPISHKASSVSQFIQALNQFIRDRGIQATKPTENDLPISENISLRQSRYHDDGEYFDFDSPTAAVLSKIAEKSALYRALAKPLASSPLEEEFVSATRSLSADSDAEVSSVRIHNANQTVSSSKVSEKSYGSFSARAKARKRGFFETLCCCFRKSPEQLKQPLVKKESPRMQRMS